MKVKETPKFQHFIITQFNLRNFPKSQNNEFEGWVEWTRERILLFKKYCLPSVLNQSEKNFTWLLYLDSETPKEFSDFIKEMNAYPNIEVTFCSGAADFQQNYMQAVKDRLYDDTQWIITSRMDNDDAVHKDMVKKIQEASEFKQGFMVSLASGYALEEKSLKMTHYFYPMAPFLALVEHRTSAKGIFEKGHTIWPNLRLWIYKEIWLAWFAKKDREVKYVLSEPLWVQIIHQKNVSNSFYRGLPVLKEKSLIDFGLNMISKSCKPMDILRCRNYVVWKRYFKCEVVRIFTKN